MADGEEEKTSFSTGNTAQYIDMLYSRIALFLPLSQLFQIT